jgi:hypothetical protein
MEAHYNNQPDQVRMLLTPRGVNEDEDANIELIGWMYEGYKEKWAEEDIRWQVVAVEHAAEVWLPTNTGRRSNFKLKMKIDLVMTDSKGRVWIWDHKSGKNLPSQKDLELDDQFGLYMYGMRKLGYDVHALMYNAARTQRNKGEMLLEDRFSRVAMVRTPHELETIAVEAWRTAKRTYAIKPHEEERNTDSERCGWRCGFTEACLLGRKTDWKRERQFLTQTGMCQDFTRH